MVTVRTACPFCKDDNVWSSQPMAANTGIPAGNIQMSAGILFSGASYTWVLRVLKAMNIRSELFDLKQIVISINLILLVQKVRI